MAFSHKNSEKILNVLIAFDIREDQEAMAFVKIRVKGRTSLREIFHGCFTIIILVIQRPTKKT